VSNFWGPSQYARTAEASDTKKLREKILSGHLLWLANEGFNSADFDTLPDCVPYFCVLAYALADQGILPLQGRLGLRWYPINNVKRYWYANHSRSKATFDQALKGIQKKFNILLLPPPDVLTV